MTHPEIAQVVRDAIMSILPNLDRAEIRGERHLKDLGADSIDRIEIILTIKRRLAITHGLERFGRLENIDALIRFLSEETPS